MKIKQIVLPTDGTPQLVRSALVDFMTIEEVKGKPVLYLLEDDDNKPTRNYYFAPFSKEITDPAKWEYFRSVKINGRVMHWFIMQG